VTRGRLVGGIGFLVLLTVFGGLPGAGVAILLVAGWWLGAPVDSFWVVGLAFLAAAPLAALASGIPDVVSPRFAQHTLAAHVLVGIGLATILLATFRELPGMRRHDVQPVAPEPERATGTVEPEGTPGHGADPSHVDATTATESSEGTQTSLPLSPGLTGRIRRTVVIGLDGATWKILGPFMEDGTMPRLAALADRSATGVLRSTFPPYTPPAWTSALTGVNPGRHGIFGFVRGRGEGTELNHWGLVRSPALWEYLGGASIGMFHVPLTYPPPRVPGWCVGAVWMPTGRPITGFTQPQELEARIRDIAPRYAPVLGVDLHEDWRGTDLAEQATVTLGDRERVLTSLLATDPVDLVFAVLETPDRLQHAYYRYLVPDQSESRRRAATTIRRAVSEAFAALDRVVGLLDDYAGPDGVALLCSDHGFTSWNGYVNGNAVLEEAGLLSLRASGRALRSVGAGRVARMASRVVPKKAGYRLRRRTSGLVDWGTTLAYTNRLGNQGFSVNLSGREPDGNVPVEDSDEVLDRLRSALEAVRTPDGDAVVAALHRREDLYRGTASEDAPDLLLEPVGWHWEVSDRIGAAGPFEDFSILPLGCHHPNGIFGLRAPGVAPNKDVEARIEDVMPTVLYASGLPVPGGLDGTARVDLFGKGAEPVATVVAAAPETPEAEENPYTPEEEAQIVKYLTDLGYLG
jgi:predicted AlkP superfamily phosphohydrolase/phosphomutase